MSDETEETLLDIENPNTTSPPQTAANNNNPDGGPSRSQRVSTVHRISISNIDINVDDIHRSLNAVNTFATKRMDKAQSILMYEITSEGESVYKSLTLRELLYYINDEAEEIDADYFEKESVNVPPSPANRNQSNHTNPTRRHSNPEQSSNLNYSTQARPNPLESRPSLANRLFGNIPYPELDEASSNGIDSPDDIANVVSSTKPFASLSSEPAEREDDDKSPSVVSEEPTHHQRRSATTEQLLIDYASELPRTTEPLEYHSDTEAITKSHPRQSAHHQNLHHVAIIGGPGDMQHHLHDHQKTMTHVTDDGRRSMNRGGPGRGVARRGSLMRQSTGNAKSMYNHNNINNTATAPTQLPQPPMTNHHFNSNNYNNDAEANEEEIFEAVNIVRLRDLRRLDTVSNPNEEKSILIRRHAIIFAMDPIRAVVMAKRIILIVPDGADSLISILDGFMKEWVDNYQRVKKQEEREQEFLKQQLNNQQNSSNKKQSTPHEAAGGLVSISALATPPSLKRSYSSQDMMMNRIRKNSKMNASEMNYIIPFEIHAYEALLMTVKELETQEFTFIHDSIQSALLYFKDAALVPIKIQSQIRQLKNDLSIMMNRVHGSRQALQYITEDDEEMALMNLTLLKKKPKLYRYPLVPEILTRHDEIEELIESYLMDFASLENKIEYVRSQIQSSEELVSLRLDTSRNELLIANTALAILSCSIAFGAYITGIFGMNLDQTIYMQPVNGTFAYVSSGSFGLMFIVFGVIYGYLRVTGVLPGKPNFPHHYHAKK